MPKRAATDDTIDPVRSRLAAIAAAPQTRPTPPKETPGDPPAIENGVRRDTQASAVPDAIETVGGRSASLSRDTRKRDRDRRPHASASKPRIMTVNRKIMVTPEEASRIEETTAAISSAFGSKVSYSQVSRAVWSILAGAEEAIHAESKRAPYLRVPSKGDHIAMAEYEDALADFLAGALKRS